MGETTAWPFPNVPYAFCFFPQFLSLMASSLSYTVGGTHTHGISAKLGHFTCAPTHFHEVHRFHSLQFARISFSLYGSTNQVLFSGWDSQSREVEKRR